MADLSLDDILAEIDKKRGKDDGGKSPAEFSVDDILGETLGDFPKQIILLYKTILPLFP